MRSPGFRVRIPLATRIIDDDLKAEDLLEEIALGCHREALDGGVGDAGKDEPEAPLVAADEDLVHALVVGALQGIRHAKECGEL